MIIYHFFLEMFGFLDEIAEMILWAFVDDADLVEIW